MAKKRSAPKVFAVDRKGRSSRIDAESLEIDLGSGRRLVIGIPGKNGGDIELVAHALKGAPVIRLQPAATNLVAVSVDAHAKGARGAQRPDLKLSVQKALDKAGRALAPPKRDIRRWARAALQRDVEVTVRLVDEVEGRELNRSYRGKDNATNVLTFVYDDGSASPAVDAPLLGDLVLCVPVVAREASEQGKPLDAHFAHLIVHGMLHLQGFDHEVAAEADIMEARETEILETLGYADPYA